MATLKAVIVPAKVLKGGKHRIRLSVAHNGETRYIVTDITIDSAKEFKNGVIVKRGDAAYLNTRLRNTMQSFQEAIYGLEYIDGLSCAELVEMVKSTQSGKSHTLQSIFSEYIAKCGAKPSSIRFYNIAYNAITRHLNPKLMLSQVTHITVMSLDRALTKRGLSHSTRFAYMSILSFIIGYAVKCGYVSYKVNPFFGYKYPKPEVRDIWLSVDEVRKIRDIQLKSKMQGKCRDIFMLSYYLGGINIVDLMKVNFNVCKDKMCYVRQKTKDLPKINKTVEFEIPDEAKEIIDRYKGEDGYLHIVSNRGVANERYRDSLFKHGFKKLAETVNVRRLVYYSARKSFSQHAFELGIGGSVIDYILGHNIAAGGKMLFRYAYVTPEMATEAIRKVIDNLK